MGLYHDYRPTDFDEIIGNKAVIKSIAAKCKKKDFPHFVLLSGPSGCGKTTIARIVAKKLKCDITTDFIEINCANQNGVELARRIEKDYQYAPLSGGCRVFLLDEAHALTKACESCLLKPLEDTPKHCYFIFATTDPQKILSTVKTRATEYKVNAFNEKQVNELLDYVCEQEEVDNIPDKVKKVLWHNCMQSARQALILLDKIIDLEEDEMIEALEVAKQEEDNLFNIVKPMFGWGCKGWKPCAEALANIDGDPEQIRRYLRTLATNQLVDASKSKNHHVAFLILDCTSHIFYDKSDLVQCCYEIINSD